MEKCDDETVIIHTEVLIEGDYIVARKKRRHHTKTVFISMLFFIGLVCIGFYIGRFIAEINATVVTTVVEKNTDIKHTPDQIVSRKESKEQLPADPNMNTNELKVIPDHTATDHSTTDVYKPDGHKIAYLTFDDGPSSNVTPGILKILDKYSIKATFFAVGQMAVNNSEVLKMEADDGQAIGNHTYSHDYKFIYANTKNFLDDLNKCNKTLKSILGERYDNRLIRFPGGSFGPKLAPFRKAAISAGYHYIDWNDLTGDAEANNVPVSKLLEELKKYTIGHEHVVILMHDAPSKETTLDALPQVIEYLKSLGYTFGTLK